jgi:hypothetical protein
MDDLSRLSLTWSVAEEMMIEGESEGMLPRLNSIEKE